MGYFAVRTGGRDRCWESWGAAPLAGGTPDGGGGPGGRGRGDAGSDTVNVRCPLDIPEGCRVDTWTWILERGTAWDANREGEQWSHLRPAET